jgi:DNA-binding winged helix-turn-helix (wHTH) protein
MAIFPETNLEVTNPDYADFELPLAMPGINRYLARGAASGEDAFLFGSFRLLPRQRLLLSGDEPVRLGGRALDILIVLVERAGDLVSKDELMARVWPNTFVVEANLTVHVSALRRALRDGVGGSRYFVNVPNRGYYFVAPVVLEGNAGTRGSIHVASPSSLTS